MILGVRDHYLSRAPAKLTQSSISMPTVNVYKCNIIQENGGLGSFVYFVKRPSVRKAGVPDLVHDLDGL